MFQTGVVEKIKTHTCSIYIYFENHAVCEIMWKKMTARQATDDNVILSILTAWWITKVTNTHSECVILFAFPR
jgi:ribosomal protein S26